MKKLENAPIGNFLYRLISIDKFRLCVIQRDKKPHVNSRLLSFNLGNCNKLIVCTKRVLPCLHQPGSENTATNIMYRPRKHSVVLLRKQFSRTKQCYRIFVKVCLSGTCKRKRKLKNTCWLSSERCQISRITTVFTDTKQNKSIPD